MVIWSKRIPRLFLRASQEPGAILQQKVMESIRVKCPKEFFAALHIINKTKKKAEFAKYFKA